MLFCIPSESIYWKKWDVYWYSSCLSPAWVLKDPPSIRIVEEGHPHHRLQYFPNCIPNPNFQVLKDFTLPWGLPTVAEICPCIDAPSEKKPQLKRRRQVDTRLRKTENTTEYPSKMIIPPPCTFPSQEYCRGKPYQPHSNHFIHRLILKIEVKQPIYDWQHDLAHHPWI